MPNYTGSMNSAPINVANFPASQPISGTVATTGYQTGSYTKTQTAVATNSVQIAAANPNRKGFIIFNNSSNSTYVSFANPADASHCARIIATFTSWEVLSPICYTGAIYAIRNAGSGDVTVWEF